MNTAIHFVKTQNGNLAAQTNVLLLRVGELQNLFPTQIKSIRDMGVKLNRVTQVSTTVIGSEKHILTQLRDSVIRDTIHVKAFSYHDNWYDISGIATSDTQMVQIHSSDTLTQVVYWGERTRPWLWVFSPRKLEQRVSLSNPNAMIKFSSLIQIQKP